jgi:hypothetical protein
MRKSRVRLQIEMLEDRTVPSGFGPTNLPAAAMGGIATATASMPSASQASQHSPVFGAGTSAAASVSLPSQSDSGIATASSHNGSSQASHSPVF